LQVVDQPARWAWCILVLAGACAAPASLDYQPRDVLRTISVPEAQQRIVVLIEQHSVAPEIVPGSLALTPVSLAFREVRGALPDRDVEIPWSAIARIELGVIRAMEFPPEQWSHDVRIFGAEDNEIASVRFLGRPRAEELADLLWSLRQRSQGR
jgi:hypothetical protein